MSRTLVPRWLGPEHDRGIAAILGTYREHEGRARRELDAALARPASVGPATSRLPDGALAPAEATAPTLDTRKAALVRASLDRHLRATVEAVVSPRSLREALFVERAASADPRSEVLGRVLDRLGVDREQLDAALFADLPAERLVSFDGEPPSVSELRADANRLLVEQLFSRSREIRLRLRGGARAVVRTAQLRGLLTVAERRGDEVVVRISGPFALFRHTRLYASATRSLVPVLARAHFEAHVLVPGPASEWTFRLSSDDPFVGAFAGSEPSFDSKLEAAFAARFPRLAPQWELVREPEPVPLASGRMIFPDFLVIDRRDPTRRVWLEIVGYWTPEYLRGKLAALDEAKLERLIVCVSDRLAAADADIPADARVVRFKGRLDPRVVLAHLEALR